MAADVGFEPTELLRSSVFKTVAFARSANPPYDSWSNLSQRVLAPSAYQPVRAHIYDSSGRSFSPVLQGFLSGLRDCTTYLTSCWWLSLDGCSQAYHQPLPGESNPFGLQNRTAPRYAPKPFCCEQVFWDAAVLPRFSTYGICPAACCALPTAGWLYPILTGALSAELRMRIGGIQRHYRVSKLFLWC